MLIGMWLIVLGLLTLFFNSWLEQQHNPNQNVRSAIAADGSREVILIRNRHGHYMARGAINGHPVDFMLDTGASDISIPASVANRLGLERGRAVTYRTANGTIVGYATQLDSVSIGMVERRGVRASINPYMGGEEILLGMSFLGDLEFSQRDGELTIRQR
ncbi:MAG: TIGR02281 family clan AA aspartic protease [Aquisalimonadaceae bacterium]